MERYKILVTPTASFGKYSDAFSRLKSAGLEVILSPYSHPLKEEELKEFISQVDGIIVGLDPITPSLLEEAKRLRVISKHGVGVDNIAVEEATRRRIVVANAPGTNDDSVADLAFAFVLSLARHIPRACWSMREEKWEKFVGVEINGKTLGVVGVGRIGKKVIRQSWGFDMEILAHDVFPDQNLAQKWQFSYVSLEKLLRESDFITLHIPLTQETRGFIGGKELSLMKRSSYLINTARGGIVDEEALYRALKEGIIAGAALDVFSQEPPGSSPLMDLENVIATPHMASDTKEAIRRMDVVSAENVIRVLRGDPPLSAVNVVEKI